MAQLVSLELILLLGVTIFGGLLYLLISSYRNRRDDDDDPSRPDPGESEEDRAWRAKRFWWFGR